MQSRETGQPKAALDEIANDSGNLAKRKKEEMSTWTPAKPDTGSKLPVTHWTPQYNSSFFLIILNEINDLSYFQAHISAQILRRTHKILVDNCQKKTGSSHETVQVKMT